MALRSEAIGSRSRRGIRQVQDRVVGSQTPEPGTNATRKRIRNRGIEEYEIPEYRRWIIQYEAEDIGSYTKQLSHFNIDIGVIHKNKNDVWRVHDVGGEASVIRSNREKEKWTFRLGHRKQRMKRWDEELSRLNGVDLTNTIINRLYPESTRAIIRAVEAAALQGTGRTLNQVRNAIFKVEPDDNGYVFTVVDILYHKSDEED